VRRAAIRPWTLKPDSWAIYDLRFTEVGKRASAGFAALSVADSAPHPASFAFIKAAPYTCALVRGKRILEAGLGNRALGTDRFRSGTGWFFFGLGEEYVAIDPIAGG
jgi:hypothetical protein